MESNPTPKETQPIPWSKHRVYLPSEGTLDVAGVKVPVKSFDGRKFYFEGATCRLVVNVKNWPRILKELQG